MRRGKKTNADLPFWDRTLNTLLLNPPKTHAKQILMWTFSFFTDCPQNKAHSMNSITMQDFSRELKIPKKSAIISKYKAQISALVAGSGFTSRVMRVEVVVSAFKLGASPSLL